LDPSKIIPGILWKNRLGRGGYCKSSAASQTRKLNVYCIVAKQIYHQAKGQNRVMMPPANACLPCWNLGFPGEEFSGNVPEIFFSVSYVINFGIEFTLFCIAKLAGFTFQELSSYEVQIGVSGKAS
jgi:hypothetical protein